MHRVIINADDFGYSRAINYGIMDAHLNGILTSTTLMANMPSFGHAVGLKKRNPTLGVGVHLVLNTGRPLIKTHKTIVDSTGSFYKASEILENTSSLSKEEIYSEWKAQINALINAGIQPTHLDSHHHLHTYQPMLEVFLQLANEFILPIRGNVSKDLHSQLTTECFEDRFDYTVRLDKSNWKQKDIDGYFDDLLDKIKQFPSIEIMTHPGYVDEFLIKNSSLNLQRLTEVTYLTDHRFAQSIKNDPEIELINFGDLI